MEHSKCSIVKKIFFVFNTNFSVKQNLPILFVLDFGSRRPYRCYNLEMLQPRRSNP